MKEKSQRRGRPPTGSALTAAERMRRMRARRKAAGLKQVRKWVSQDLAEPYFFSPHRISDARSLAMHAVIAQKIEREPRLLDIARRNLQRWAERHASAEPKWLTEWREILNRSWPQIAALLTEQSEEAARLRQSTPFAGILTASERRRIHEAFRA